MAEANEADTRRQVTLLCGAEAVKARRTRSGSTQRRAHRAPGGGSGLRRARSLRVGERAQRRLRATDTRNRPTPAPSQDLRLDARRCGVPQVAHDPYRHRDVDGEHQSRHDQAAPERWRRARRGPPAVSRSRAEPRGPRSRRRRRPRLDFCVLLAWLELYHTDQNSEQPRIPAGTSSPLSANATATSSRYASSHARNSQSVMPAPGRSSG